MMNPAKNGWKLLSYLSKWGFLITTDKATPKQFCDVVKKIEGRPDQTDPNYAFALDAASGLRPHNVGHFGLVLDAYAHFTSPIRRYPD